MYMLVQKVYDDKDDPFEPNKFARRAKVFATESIETMCNYYTTPLQLTSFCSSLASLLNVLNGLQLNPHLNL